MVNAALKRARQGLVAPRFSWLARDRERPRAAISRIAASAAPSGKVIGRLVRGTAAGVGGSGGGSQAVGARNNSSRTPNPYILLPTVDPERVGQARPEGELVLRPDLRHDRA